MPQNWLRRISQNISRRLKHLNKRFQEGAYLIDDVRHGDGKFAVEIQQKKQMSC